MNHWMRVARKAASLRPAITALAMALVLVGAMALRLGLSSSAQANNRDSDDKNLQGAWHVVVQRLDCQTGTHLGPSFNSFLTFADGGTLTEVPGTPTFLPGQRTPGVGVWKRTGERSFKAVSTAFILFDSASPPYVLSSPLPPSFPLFHRGTQTITQTIEVHGDEFTANSSVQFFDTNGNQLSTICANVTGNRLEIEDRDSAWVGVLPDAARFAHASRNLFGGSFFLGCPFVLRRRLAGILQSALSTWLSEMNAQGEGQGNSSRG